MTALLLVLALADPNPVKLWLEVGERRVQHFRYPDGVPLVNMSKRRSLGVLVYCDPPKPCVRLT